MHMLLQDGSCYCLLLCIQTPGLVLCDISKQIDITERNYMKDGQGSHSFRR